MCIPHVPAGIQSHTIKVKEKKHIEKISKAEYEKGDPDFIDERITSYIPKEKKTSFFTSLFGS